MGADSPFAGDNGRLAGLLQARLGDEIAYVPVDDLREKTLIRRAQAGDAEAAAALYHQHAEAIFRYLFFRVHDRATAEDLTSEVFLKMVEALPRFADRGAPFAAWLFRIAHDRMVDHHRRAAYRQTEALAETLEDHRPGPEAQAVTRGETDHLREALGSLTDEQRLVMQLRFVEGYSLEDTARILEKTTGAVKAQQHRALRQLARILNR